MASSSKKSKKDPVPDAMSGSYQYSFSHLEPTEEEMHETFRHLTIDLRAEAGIIGTVEEQNAYDQVMSGEGDASADQPEIDKGKTDP